MFKNSIVTLVGSTAFEVAGLILWFEFDRHGIPAGLVVMFLGFVLERIWVIGMPDSFDVWLGVIGSSWWEYAVWALWFILIISRGAGPIEVFVLVFFPGIHFQHCFGASMKFNRPFPELVRHRGFIAFSLIEAIGGGIWLSLFVSQSPSLWPHIIIAITILIEHIVQGFALGSLTKTPASTNMAAAS